MSIDALTVELCLECEKRFVAVVACFCFNKGRAYFGGPLFFPVVMKRDSASMV